jgi:hypothetical protein
MGPEEATIRAFVAPNRRARWLEAVQNPKVRGQMTGRLAHDDDFLDQYVQDFRPSGKRDAEVAAIVQEMTRRGAPATCHVISENDDVDGQVLPLLDALDATLGWSAALLICLPGKLALHLPEPPSHPVILPKPPSR